MRELSLNVMDIAQNSVTANSSQIMITVLNNIDDEVLTITIEDNGKGMTKEQVQSVIDPFFTTRTTRKVGLGVPLFKMAAEMTGGSLNIDSTVGVGTKLTATFNTSHIDMVPLGDINGTILPLVTGNTHIDFIYTYAKLKDNAETSFELNTNEIKEVLGEDVSLDMPEIVVWLKDFLEENTIEIDNN